jgi:hypothetical protein
MKQGIAQGYNRLDELLAAAAGAGNVGLSDSA